MVAYQLSRYSVHFGEIPYNESSMQEFFIENIGKVPFEYTINLDTLQRPGILEVSPAQGKVAAAEKAKISMKITPGIPDYLEEVIQVEVAHHDPILLKLSAKGIYPALLFHLPRPEDPKHAEVLDKVREQKEVPQTNFEASCRTQRTKARLEGP